MTKEASFAGNYKMELIRQAFLPPTNMPLEGIDHYRYNDDRK
ncbi:hypothetical protein ACFLUF_03295 [Chloroflexota bacterium]